MNESENEEGVEGEIEREDEASVLSGDNPECEEKTKWGGIGRLIDFMFLYTGEQLTFRANIWISRRAIYKETKQDYGSECANTTRSWAWNVLWADLIELFYYIIRI